MPSLRRSESSFRAAFQAARSRRHALGFTLTEIVVATGIAALLAASLIGALLSTQRLAATSRAMTNARVIVQRNIDTALGVKFTSAIEPEILQVTSAEGVAFGDYNDLEEELLSTESPLPVHTDRSGTNLIQGRLTRIVSEYPPPAALSHLVIREVTFRIDYEFNGRSYTYSMTTLRSQDNQ